jgi:transcriptional regulator with AAA-type ATPase domain
MSVGYRFLLLSLEGILCRLTLEVLMQIPTLVFLSSFPGSPPRVGYLNLEKGLDLSRTMEPELPAAYVLRDQDLEHLRPFTAQVVDRGVKHKAKGLSQIVMGQKRIPLVNGNFSALGQLRRSLRTLLANAQRSGERNLYFIGVQEEFFQELWEQSQRGPGGHDLEGGARMSSPSFSPGPITRELSSRFLLELMGSCEEPPELGRRLIGESLEAQLVRQLILHAARVDDTVLILGDTGTGKEVAARAIHDYGPRRQEKFTSVNCGAIPQELLESELFGHQKGSFTGAVHRKMSLWEVADRGTLFLDQVGDLALGHQVKILHALQNGCIRRVGGEKEIQVDARVIAATNRNLFSMVQAGHFREDLYYRLREFLIHTPALRDHPGDIPLLAQAFWAKIVHDETKALSNEILQEFKSYRWPGNARELKTVLTNLRALFGPDHLRVDHLRAVFLLQGQTLPRPREATASLKSGLKRMASLRQLQRVDEMLRTTEVTLPPLFGEQKTDTPTVAGVQTSLKFRLCEMEMLCLHPLLFPSEAMFSRVYQLKGKLTYLESLLTQDAHEGRRFWEKQVAGEMGQVLTAISQEIKGLSATAS